MRRVVAAVAMAGLVGLALPATAGVAAPAPSAPAPSAAAGGDARGTEVCTIKDDKLIELSGLAATATGYVTMNDSTDVSSRARIFQLDNACRVTKSVAYPSPGQRDPEDLAVGKDGSIWIADIGDDPRDPKRTNIALWKFPPDLTGKATLYRLKYPDGAHDAEALILGPDDTPIIVTKTVGAAGIYVPAGPLTPSTSTNQTVSMSKAGEFRPTKTSTSTPLGFIGQTQVTGGTSSQDRAKVVLRTYSDAYEWDVPDGDVVKAITSGKPRITPLPDEPQGEAIAYSADGASFITVSEVAELPGNPQPKILRYAPSTGQKPAAATNATPIKKNGLSWYERMSLTQATSLIAGVGVIGVLLVAAGVIGIMRTRSRTVTRKGGKDKDSGPSDGDVPGDNYPTAVLTAVRDGYGDDYGGYPATAYPPGGYPGSGYGPDDYDPYGNPHGYGSGYPPAR